MKKALNYFLFGIFCLVSINACSSNGISGTGGNWSKSNNNRKVATQLDREEAIIAFHYLNKVRSNPDAHSREIGADLSYVQPMGELKLNSILTKVAEAKAADMATRNYFNHLTPEGIGINIMIHNAGYSLPESWIASKNANYFESIAARYNGRSYTGGVELIRQLILDPDVPDLGHRIHLLGLDKWTSELTDVGIGIARNPDSYYRNYICVIIAKKDDVERFKTASSEVNK